MQMFSRVVQSSMNVCFHRQRESVGTAGKRVELILKMTHVSIYGHVSIVTVMCALCRVCRLPPRRWRYHLGGGSPTVSVYRASSGRLQVWHDRYMYLACSRPIDELAARLQCHLYCSADGTFSPSAWAVT